MFNPSNEIKVRPALSAWLSLFTASGTLVCCALPALFVALGLGAAFAGLVNALPQLIWFSEHKAIVFTTGAIMLTVGGWMQWRARSAPCPTDPKLAAACTISRLWALRIYWVSIIFYLIGAGFAFLPQLLM